MAITPERLSVLQGRVNALHATDPNSVTGISIRNFLADAAPDLIAELRRLHDQAAALDDTWEQREEQAIDRHDHPQATAYNQARDDLASLFDGTLPASTTTER